MTDLELAKLFFSAHQEAKGKKSASWDEVTSLVHDSYLTAARAVLGSDPASDDVQVRILTLSSQYETAKKCLHLTASDRDMWKKGCTEWQEAGLSARDRIFHLEQAVRVACHARWADDGSVDEEQAMCKLADMVGSSPTTSVLTPDILALYRNSLEAYASRKGPDPASPESEANDPLPWDDEDQALADSASATPRDLPPLEVGSFVRITNGGRGRIVRGPCYVIDSDGNGRVVEDSSNVEPLKVTRRR